MTLEPPLTDDAAEPPPPDTPTAPDAGIRPAAPAGEKDWLTTPEASQVYRIKAGTLRYWRHIGYGPASFTLGRRKVVYRRGDFDAWIAEQERRTRRGGTNAA
ncbi:helix-turn-helix transcriptional regulator [Nocardia vaccinii]|uniref:helix-turn-helix transcriptional regulator n=1 Tax=Nocardia vaccinii TaxID=1822 RepID=UPI0035A21F58